jgi:hypothetical protein
VSRTSNLDDGADNVVGTVNSPDQAAMAPIKPSVMTPPYRVAVCLRAQRGTDELGVRVHAQSQ